MSLPFTHPWLLAKERNLQADSSLKTHIDNIVKANSNHPCATSQQYQQQQQHRKDPKTYCTKWIHEGTCAFVQQGCRYKHEMPLDRETQLTVGLNNGLPAWWKKKMMQAEEAMARTGVLTPDATPRKRAWSGAEGAEGFGGYGMCSHSSQI